MIRDIHDIQNDDLFINTQKYKHLITTLELSIFDYDTKIQKLDEIISTNNILIEKNIDLMSSVFQLEINNNILDEDDSKDEDDSEDEDDSNIISRFINYIFTKTLKDGSDS